MNVPFPVTVAAHAAALVLVAVACARFARSPRGRSQEGDAAPRRSWGKLVALVLVVSGIGLSADAWIIEPRRLVVREETIDSGAFRGAPLRIAAIGDVHIGGPHMSLSRLADVIERVNAQGAELVVLLGDYIDGHERIAARSLEERADLATGIAMLGRLRADLGVLAVIGNHDVWYDRDSVVAGLEAASIRVLENRHVVLRRGDGSELVVAGLEDATTQSPDYAAALRGAPEGIDRIVLAHSPDPFAGSPQGIALTVAAHTHCGQVLVPFVGRPMIPSPLGQRYACGLIVERGQPLYVTAGLGTSILPVRFLTPPEISLLTLRPL